MQKCCRANSGGCDLAKEVMSYGSVSAIKSVDWKDTVPQEAVLMIEKTIGDTIVTPYATYGFFLGNASIGYAVFFTDGEETYVACYFKDEPDRCITLLSFIHKKIINKAALKIFIPTYCNIGSFLLKQGYEICETALEGWSVFFETRGDEADSESFYEIECYDTDELLRYSIERYTPEYREEWDESVNKSINGTFLQTQKFLEYHPAGRFRDDSLIIRKSGKICALVPGVDCFEDGRRIFHSYRGSTFGGVILVDGYYNINSVKYILKILEDRLCSEGYQSIVLKNTSSIFCKTPTELLDYYLHKRGYSSYSELSHYVDCTALSENVVESFSRHKRKHYKESKRYNLEYREFSSDGEIETFHKILCENLKIHRSLPTHTLDELLDLYHNRIRDRILFFGVYYEGRLVAGAMLFIFNEHVIHTQYIATDYDYAHTYCTYYLYGQIIASARDMGYDKLSFGISTEGQGKYLNEGLALLKEGFGSDYVSNYTYQKNLK